MELLGSADEFVAVHLGHEEVAEQEVERTGDGVGDGVECFLGCGDGDDAVAAGFEEEGSDGEDLFVVVDAEDGFLRAHGFSVLPAGAGDRLQNRYGRRYPADGLGRARLLVGRRVAGGVSGSRGPSGELPGDPGNRLDWTGVLKRRFRTRFSCPAGEPVSGLPRAKAGRRTVGERAGGGAGCLGAFGVTHALRLE